MSKIEKSGHFAKEIYCIPNEAMRAQTATDTKERRSEHLGGGVSAVEGEDLRRSTWYFSISAKFEGVGGLDSKFPSMEGVQLLCLVLFALVLLL